MSISFYFENLPKDVSYVSYITIYTLDLSRVTRCDLISSVLFLMHILLWTPSLHTGWCHVAACCCFGILAIYNSFRLWFWCVLDLLGSLRKPLQLETDIVTTGQLYVTRQVQFSSLFVPALISSNPFDF